MQPRPSTSSTVQKAKRQRTGAAAGDFITMDDLQKSLASSSKWLEQMALPIPEGAKAKRKPYARYVYESLLTMSSSQFRLFHNKMAPLLARREVQQSDDDDDNDDDVPTVALPPSPVPVPAPAAAAVPEAAAVRPTSSR